MNSSAVSDPFGYEAQQGYYTDQSTGLILTTFRYYDPAAGRFLNRDPISYAGGMNVYGYCGNGPMAGTDPLGLDDDPFNNATNFFAGAGSTLTGGLTQTISNAIGQGMGLGNTDDMVDTCSGWHTGGQIAGAGLGLAMGGGEGVEAGVVEDLGKGAEGFGEEGGVICEGGCFVAGTQVQMADGSTKSIDKIKVGDEVKSRDPATGKDKDEPVLRLYIHPAPQIMVLHLSDGEEITCTPEHRFYVPGKGFEEAGELTNRDRLVCDSEEIASATTAGAEPKQLNITSITWEAEAPTTTTSRPVYNFEVANTHTYFVGAGWGGVWVHNSCGLTPVFRAVSPGEAADIDGSGVFNALPGQMEGKWFASSAEDEASWGDSFYPDGNYQIFSAEFPSSTIDGAFTNPHLDNIGPAWYIEGGQLGEASGITLLPR